MKETPGRMIPEQIIDTIQRSDNVVLFTHTHPDGDALGSLFGLADILESLGKNVFCYLEEPISYLYDFLPNIEKAHTSLEEYWGFVTEAGENILGIALDCGDDDRLGGSKQEFLKIKPFIVIDHHTSHRDFGTAQWVETNCSSTGEMVYELAIGLGALISYNCAFNLYVAICTDTGSFRYEATGPRTMRIAAELLEKGVRPEIVGRHLYDNFSQERLHLMKLVLSTITLCESGQVAFIHVTDEMLEESGATLQDVEGFIDFPRSLRSVKVAALIKESNNGFMAVSLRAKGQCDVAEVAKLFDGGGHRNAAGFRCLGKSIDEVRREVKDALAKALNKEN
ncbi:MAG: bifunctional oligoribonuclease/PAP phosphatase NrnA [Desulforhopalus sp.]